MNPRLWPLYAGWPKVFLEARQAMGRVNRTDDPAVMAVVSPAWASDSGLVLRGLQVSFEWINFFLTHT